MLVLGVGTLAGYYLSRFNFAGRASFLQALLVLHAFPALTLIIPIFLLMYWIGLLDTLTGVILVITTLELPFAVFIMKGFFDAVPWDIEMSALVDGASRRQAFFKVVLPQVKVGLLAVGVFAFIRGWEEYVFVRTLLFDKQNWTMSLYIFWVSEDIMGVDYGVVAAVGVFYVRAVDSSLCLLPEIPGADEPRRDQGLRHMARIELDRVGKRWGDVTAVEPTDLRDRGRRVRRDPRARRAAASRRRSSCSPASTRRARARSASTGMWSTRSRRATAMSASSFSPMRSTRT